MEVSENYFGYGKNLRFMEDVEDVAEISEILLSFDEHVMIFSRCFASGYASNPRVPHSEKCPWPSTGDDGGSGISSTSGGLGSRAERLPALSDLSEMNRP